MCLPPPLTNLVELRNEPLFLNNPPLSSFQALNDMERADWLENITTAILAGLVGEAKVSAPPAKKEATVQVCGEERGRGREEGGGRGGY